MSSWDSPDEFLAWLARRPPSQCSPCFDFTENVASLVSLALPGVKRYKGEPTFLFSFMDRSIQGWAFRQEVIPTLELWCAPGKVASFSYESGDEMTAVYIGPPEEWWRGIGDACEGCKRGLAEGRYAGKCTHVTIVAESRGDARRRRLADTAGLAASAARIRALMEGGASVSECLASEAEFNRLRTTSPPPSSGATRCQGSTDGGS